VGIAPEEKERGSARRIFGDRIGDPSAERLLEALRAAPDGLTDKEINVEVFSRNKSANELARVKKLLLNSRLIFEWTKTGALYVQLLQPGTLKDGHGLLLTETAMLDGEALKAFLDALQPPERREAA
jgi:hypothetical protein